MSLRDDGCILRSMPVLNLNFFILIQKGIAVYSCQLILSVFTNMHSYLLKTDIILF